MWLAGKPSPAGRARPVASSYSSVYIYIYIYIYMLVVSSSNVLNRSIPHVKKGGGVKRPF